MERTTSIDDAKKIFGHNFIGAEELSSVADKIGFEIIPANEHIPYDKESLKQFCDDYLLIWGGVLLRNGSPLTLNSLRGRLGIDPGQAEPCFYNQDWYQKEDFMNRPVEPAWYLIRKNILNNSRAAAPEILIKKHVFPAAVLCAYSFFVYFYLRGEFLWQNDFVWCDDVDINGDRIYVGRYKDPKGINKNGFNIHRHLSIRSNYGCADIVSGHSALLNK